MSNSNYIFKLNKENEYFYLGNITVTYILHDVVQ